ncbi:MAG: ATP-grasp domain-containing protein [Nanoarchaeota archaeon]|nr:ATP-grasp domain-containing protein [Nanoarchaeota archaeon]MBU1849600.1 ATP-grasp domain-containing protein [Nanoarchaeota archaeon]
MKVGVIFNGFSGKVMTPEEEELRAMGLSAERVLKELGFEVTLYDMDNPKNIEKLCDKSIDVAFNVCERINNNSVGEAYVAAFLEMLNIPHTRADSSLLIMGINKQLMKAVLSYNNIPTPKFQIFSNTNQPLNRTLRFPLIVKGVRCENSIGISSQSVVDNEIMLRKRVDYVLKELKQEAIVEEFIDGRELNVAILGGKQPIILPISEIVFDNLPTKKRICDYEAKWFPDSEMYKKTIPRCPAILTMKDEKVVKDVALKCYKLLEATSYARVDMRFKEGVPYVLEINHNPSIGEEGCGFVRSANSYGLSYKNMIKKILDCTIEKIGAKR